MAARSRPKTAGNKPREWRGVWQASLEVLIVIIIGWWKVDVLQVAEMIEEVLRASGHFKSVKEFRAAGVFRRDDGCIVIDHEGNEFLVSVRSTTVEE